MKTYININQLLHGPAVQKQIWSTVNNSAYFTALNPVHQIIFVRIQAAGFLHPKTHLFFTTIQKIGS
jgi:hypothetical protein